MPSIVRCTMFLLLVAQYPVSGYAQNSPATCEPTSWVPPGFQAILLGAPFQQYGNITAINASMYFSDPSFAHAIYLQVWRPVSQSTFTLIIQQYFFADPWVTQLPSTTLMFPAQFRNSPSIQLSFIPNDVLGYYVVTGSANIDQLGYASSLSPILGNSSQPASMDVYTSNSSVPLQSISISGAPTYHNVHPYITIAYVTSSPSQSVGGVQRSTITVLGACPVSFSILTPTNTPKPTPSSQVYNSIFPSTTPLDATSSPLPLTSSLPSTPTVSTSPLPPSTTTLPTSSSPFIIVGAIAGAVCLLLCVGIVGTVAFILRSRQRTTKMASGLLKAKPDDPDINGEIVHYESKHGVLYALPDKQKDGVPRPCYNENNIESYASSYEVNGQVHMYQEAGETLNMTSPVYQQIPADVDHASPPHHHPGPIAADLMSSSHSIPLASPSRTPCTPYSDPKVTAPPTFIPPRSRTLSTHTSKPSVPQNPIATLTRPLPPRPPLSTHNSPPAWDEQQKPSTGVNRLFIELDEQGFHVPSSLERQSFTNSSHQDIYSRLAHPKATNRNSHDSNFFEQNEMFWDPPSSTKELYDVLSRRKYREIHRNDLSVVSTLGSGNFGTVCKGVWTFPGGHIEVAMKTLKDGASEEDKVKFLQEAAIMGQFSHPNVVKLYGVVTVGDPLLLVLELIPNGDLRKFVMQYRRKKSTRHPSTILIPASLPKTFIAFAKDIACGMTYLSRKNYVHRDLAARNIFLTEDLRCKIGDFGMARDLAQSYAGIYQSQGGMIPLKWSAPEAIEHHQYITASDVWSFGMVLYEVWSLGHKPFGKVSPEKLANLVTSGYCQPPPPGCPRTIYGLMVQCWNPKAVKRPSFSELYRQLGRPVEELLEWCEEDRQCGELVTELGAPMACSRNLYPDLQNTYSASTYV